MSTGSFDPTTPVLMPYWDDMDFRTAGFSGAGVYTQLVGTAPNRQWVVEWRGQHFDDTGTAETLNYAIVFNEGSDSFSYVYALTGVAVPGGSSATIGIQAATTGTQFTQFSFNTSSVTPGQRLTATRAAGICNPGTGGCVTCSYSINPTSINVAAAGTTDNVGVTTATGCAWTAVSNDAFITVNSGASGSGNGIVNYTVAANSGSARTGTVTIAGQTFTVNQAAAGGGGSCGTPANINSLVSFTGSGSLQAPTCGAQGYSNDYVLNATITNTSSQTLCTLSTQVVELSETGGAPPASPFRLISADGASCTTGGLPGAVQTISSPATLAPGQSANVTFRIALPSARRFRFVINVFGGIQTGGFTAIPAAKSMMAKAFEMNVEPEQAAKAQTFASDRNRSGLRRR
jgi:hypothetical protein